MRTTVRILSQEERDQIHERTLTILEKTGVRVETEKGRAILADAGAEVDEVSRIVKFPKAFVEAMVKQVPQKYSLGGRRSDWSLPINEGECTICMSGEGTMMLDRETGECRDSTKKDLLEVTRLCDSIDEIGIYWQTVTPNDAGDRIIDYVDNEIRAFRNFSKHIQEPFIHNVHGPWMLEILQAIFGDKEKIRKDHPYSFLITPQSPLAIVDDIDPYLNLKGWDIPVAIMPMALMGATAPGSMLSTILQLNCEVIATLCLVQANEPGVPVIYAPALTLMDPRSGRYFAGGAENALMNSAATEMARYYNLAAFSSGLGTDAFEPSIQAGYERAMLGMLPIMTWPDIFIGPGLFGGDMILSLEQIMIDMEIFRMGKQIKRGILSDESRWLDDTIQEIGPGGNYLTHPSTFRQIRAGDWYIPKLGVHDSHENWVAEGKPDVLDEARVKVDDILGTHEPLPFNDDVEKELAKIRKKAEAVEGSFPFV
ncbi:MAG: trimethylamine methyltransferase family protein [Desulfobacterales bacterium]|nr:trimethylamine methyltransferase family protein [Desulfobacterales bacterium]